jgi:serine/threonine-protein kinase
LAELGEGGMGYVYRAYDGNLDTDVVIKAPRRSMMEDEEGVKRFALENRALVKLAHPHVVKILDVGEHDDLPFTVMQYLSGGNLEDRLHPSAGTAILPPQHLNTWLRPVAQAIDFIHSQGFVHRDVKPANILCPTRGWPRLPRRQPFPPSPLLVCTRCWTQRAAMSVGDKPPPLSPAG